MTPEQAASKYHWVRYDSATNTIELYLDHHSLSTARMCEANFYFKHILHVSMNYGKQQEQEILEELNRIPTAPIIVDPNNLNTAIAMPSPTALKILHKRIRKPWFLDFGEYLHYMFEVFYDSFIHREKFDKTDFALSPEQKCINLVEYLKIGRIIWQKMDMDWYKGKEDKYDEVGGWEGVSALLCQYYVYYMDLRVRVVDTEIIFGYNKEVPVGDFVIPLPSTDGGWYPQLVKCFLTGRIDLLIDNGQKIGPVDHKHTHKFRGDEGEHYNPQDAVTGYILAARNILKNNYPKYFEQGRECLSAWVYHISGCTPSKNKKTGMIGPRFKTTPIFKTEDQLESFRARQLSTFKRICELLFNNKTPEWNTLVCDNWFNRECEYKLIHRSPESEWTHIISQSYKVGEQWNPRERDSDKLKLEEMREEKEPVKCQS